MPVNLRRLRDIATLESGVGIDGRQHAEVFNALRGVSDDDLKEFEKKYKPVEPPVVVDPAPVLNPTSLSGGGASEKPARVKPNGGRRDRKKKAE